MLRRGTPAPDWERLGLEVRERFLSTQRLVLVEARDGSDATAVRDRVEAAALPQVDWIEVDRRLEIESRNVSIPPNDPRYGSQWYLPKVSIEGAWRLASGRPETIIAVVDNGCDLNHPDLDILPDDPGLDVVDNDEIPAPEPNADGNNHGTACAGVAAARGDNGEGIAGACPQCRLQCYRMLAPRGVILPLSATVRVFDRIRTSSAAVVSNSWGYVGGSAVPAPVAAAIQDLQENGNQGRGALVVFAAGNDRARIPDDDIAALPGVVTVSSTNLFDETTSFSSFGPSVDLAAPAGTVTTDISGPDGQEDGDYTASFGGTSSACPLVAGIAGLLFSTGDEVTADEVRAALISSAKQSPFATPNAMGHDDFYGFGIVNAEGALRTLLDLPDVEQDAGVPDLGAGGGAEPADMGAEDLSGPAETPSPEPNGCRHTDPASAWVGLMLMGLGWLVQKRRLLISH